MVEPTYALIGQCGLFIESDSSSWRSDSTFSSMTGTLVLAKGQPIFSGQRLADSDVAFKILRSLGQTEFILRLY